MRTRSSQADSSPPRHLETRLESGSKVFSSRLRVPREPPAAGVVIRPVILFSKIAKPNAAAAIALVLSSGETRLYHDRFNFSGMPVILRRFRSEGWTFGVLRGFG